MRSKGVGGRCGLSGGSSVPCGVALMQVAHVLSLYEKSSGPGVVALVGGLNDKRRVLRLLV